VTAWEEVIGRSAKKIRVNPRRGEICGASAHPRLESAACIQ
jgi:hypothetical protein